MYVCMYVCMYDICLFVCLAPVVPESALPLGMVREEGSTQLLPVEPSMYVHMESGTKIHV